MSDHPEPGSWSVPITDGELVISEATADLRAMPPVMIESATRLLGMAPVYCLSIFAAACGVPIVVWVPETLRTLCDLLILADQAADPVPPSDSRRLARRALGERS
jgi:hypothetical protein